MKVSISSALGNTALILLKYSPLLSPMGLHACRMKLILILIHGQAQPISARGYKVAWRQQYSDFIQKRNPVEQKRPPPTPASPSEEGPVLDSISLVERDTSSWVTSTPECPKECSGLCLTPEWDCGESKCDFCLSLTLQALSWRHSPEAKLSILQND